MRPQTLTLPASAAPALCFAAYQDLCVLLPAPFTLIACNSKSYVCPACEVA